MMIKLYCSETKQLAGGTIVTTRPKKGKARTRVYTESVGEIACQGDDSCEESSNSAHKGETQADSKEMKFSSEAISAKGVEVHVRGSAHQVDSVTASALARWPLAPSTTGDTSHGD